MALYCSAMAWYFTDILRIILKCEFEKNKTVLDNINFKLLPGQKICIMGDGGSGKSLLLELISGTLNNYEGTITINKIPLFNINQNEYRKKIGIFYNEQDIFDGSLYENITMGNNSIDAKQIMELAEILGLKDFINEIYSSSAIIFVKLLKDFIIFGYFLGIYKKRGSVKTLLKNLFH